MPKGLRRSMLRQTKPTVFLPTYTVAAAPKAADHAGCIIRVSNGSAGSACVAMSDGTNWKVIALGANIAAS